MRDVLHVAPVLRVAVLQPEDAGGDVGRHVLDVGRVNRFISSSGPEDLDRVKAVAVGTAVERALDASVKETPDEIHRFAPLPER